MRIVAVIPTYKRKKITTATINYLKQQTYPLEAIVVVGSEPNDREAAEIAGATYVNYSNDFLSAKIQAGVDRAKKFSPDALLMAGSDDWLSLNWIEKLVPYLPKFDIIGGGKVYIFNYSSKQLIYIPIYIDTPRYGEPLGPGRLISRRILDEVGWKLFNKTVRRSVDGWSFQHMKTHGAHILVYHADDIKALDIIGPWSKITSWEVCKREKKIIFIKDAIFWMENFFPGVLSNSIFQEALNV